MDTSNDQVEQWDSGLERGTRRTFEGIFITLAFGSVVGFAAALAWKIFT